MLIKALFFLFTLAEVQEASNNIFQFKIEMEGLAKKIAKSLEQTYL